MEYLRNSLQRSTNAAVSPGQNSLKNVFVKSSSTSTSSPDVFIVGAGMLGQSLIKLPSFAQHGFQVVGLFDNDPAKIGLHLNGLLVESPDLLSQRVEQKGVSRAIIAVPTPAAQKAADQLVKAGIRLILNYAPINLSVPSIVVCERIDPALQFSRLSFRLPSLLDSILLGNLNFEAYNDEEHITESNHNIQCILNMNINNTTIFSKKEISMAIFNAQNSNGYFSPLRGLATFYPYFIECMNELRKNSFKTYDQELKEAKEKKEEKNSFFQFLQTEKELHQSPKLIKKKNHNASLQRNDVDEEEDSSRLITIMLSRNTTPKQPNANYNGYHNNHNSNEAVNNMEFYHQFNESRPSSAPAKIRKCKILNSDSEESKCVSNIDHVSNSPWFFDSNRISSFRNNIGLHGLEDAQTMLSNSIISDKDGGFAFSGVLLYGPPGSGKSDLMNDVINSSIDQYGIFNVCAGDLTSATLISNLFSDAKGYVQAVEEPVLICIDSFDIIFKNNHLKFALLKELDRSCNFIMVLACTNLPWELDMSMLRHFERRIGIPLPNQKAREKIFKNSINDKALPELTNDELVQLSQATEGYSASDITSIVKHIYAISTTVNAIPTSKDIDRIPNKIAAFDYLKAVSNIKPSISKEILFLYDTFTARFGYCIKNSIKIKSRTCDPSYLSLYC